MRHLLLLLALAPFGPAWATPTEPELMSYQEFMYMSLPARERYLTEVVAALRDYENGADDIFAADEFASYPYFREMFADVLRNVRREIRGLPWPTAQAALEQNKPAAAPDPCVNVSFALKSNYVCGQRGEPGDPNYVYQCVDIAPKTAARVNSNQSNRLQPLINECRPKFNEAKGVPEAYAKYAKTEGPKSPAFQEAAKEETRKAEQEKADKSKTEADAKAAKKAADEAEANKKLGDVKCGDAKVKEADRQKYRKDGQACLIGGQISSYDTKGGPCKTVQTDTTKDKAKKGSSICSDANTFGKGKGGAKVSKFRRTACQPMLFCRTDKSAFCVDAGKDVLGACEAATKDAANKSKLSNKCIGDGDRTPYNEFKAQVGVLCHEDYLKANAVMCKDCGKLVAKLNAAFSSNATGATMNQSGGQTNSGAKAVTK